MWKTWSCCGKSICGACCYDNQMAIGKENEKKAARKQKLLDEGICPFCRAPSAENFQERIGRLENRIRLGDAKAMWLLATYHRDGIRGTARDESKALHLFKKSANLGNSLAHTSLGFAYRFGKLGVGIDAEKATTHFELAAKSGDVFGRHNLGNDAIIDSVPSLQTILHWRISAAAGFTPSVTCLIQAFEFGLIRHKDLASSLRARDKASLAMKSESRVRYIAYLKRTGQLDAQMGLLTCTE